MCGRFTLTLEISALQMAFDLGEQTVVWQSNYNVAPSTLLPVLTNQQPEKIQLFRWGLIPSWSKDPSIGAKMINARSETLQEKPSFRSAFQSRRCLIPADGFFEWKNTGASKVPYYFHKPDHSLFLFAGLWDSWIGSGNVEPVHTFTILTCAPNAVVAPVHDRMPVILDWEHGKTWLQSGQNVVTLQSMLKPAEENFLSKYPVSSKVNSPANNSAVCIQPIQSASLF
jgi:putative SOS response-associated peptidase YedK